MNAKSWTFQKSGNPAVTEDLDQGKQNNNDPVSPFKMYSQIRVHQYLQTSPTPAAKDCKCEAHSVTAKEEDYNSSPRSHSTPSPFSDLSSRAGSRLGRGMFYGSPPASGVTDPVCPFPEDWQYNFIPDTVENNDEID